MLFLDGERFNWEKDQTPTGKRVRSQIEDIKKRHGIPLEISYPDNWIKVRQPDESGMDWGGLDQPSGFSVLLKRNLETPEGVENWIYCDTTKMDKTGNSLYIPRHFPLGPRTKINNVELAWFFLYVSPKVSYKEKKGQFIVVDELQAARNENSNKKLRIQAEARLYSEDLYIGDEKVRLIAASWNIKGSEKEDIDILISQLWGAVEAEERKTGTGYDKLIKATKIGADLILRSRLQQAEEKGVIVFNQKEQAWFFIDEDGEQGNEITQVTNELHKYDELALFYKSNPKEEGLLNKALGITKEVVEVDIEKPRTLQFKKK
jgi:hypothetical protein